MTTMPTAGPTTAQRYADLSRRQTRRGNARRAQLAAWAADVHVLEELLWENGLDEAPDPHEQLATIGEAIASAIEAMAADTADDLTPRQVVELARHAMVTTFDASVHALLQERFADLGHLDALAQPGPEEGARHAEPQPEDLLDGRAPEQLVTELRTAAADCMAVAELMATEGEPEAAQRMARQADNAAFEAYLVTAAIAAGDTGLATADLRWQLARDAEETGPAQDLGARRALLGSLVGSAERPALDAIMEQW